MSLSARASDIHQILQYITRCCECCQYGDAVLLHCLESIELTLEFLIICGRHIRISCWLHLITIHLATGIVATPHSQSSLCSSLGADLLQVKLIQIRHWYACSPTEMRFALCLYAYLVIKRAWQSNTHMLCGKQGHSETVYFTMNQLNLSTLNQQRLCTDLKHV